MPRLKNLECIFFFTEKHSLFNCRILRSKTNFFITKKWEWKPVTLSTYDYISEKQAFINNKYLSSLKNDITMYFTIFYIEWIIFKQSRVKLHAFSNPKKKKNNSLNISPLRIFNEYFDIFLGRTCSRVM